MHSNNLTSPVVGSFNAPNSSAGKSFKTLGIVGLIALITFGPMIIAWMLWSSGIHFKTLNHGHLITPPIPLAQLHLKDDLGLAYESHHFQNLWWMVYISPPGCGKDCLRSLYDMRQIRLATGKNAKNIGRLWVSVDQPKNINVASHAPVLVGAYRGTIHAWVAPEALRLALAPVVNQAKSNDLVGLYLVDQKGSIMMRYPRDFNARHVLKDLTRLLQVANI